MCCFYPEMFYSSRVKNNQNTSVVSLLQAQTHCQLWIDNGESGVYSLVPSEKRYLPDFTQYPLVTGPVHSEAISTPRGAYRPAAISGAQNYSNTQVFTVLPGTHLLLGGESGRVGKVPCLRAQRRSIIQPSRGPKTRSLACKSRTPPLSHDAPRSKWSVRPLWRWSIITELSLCCITVAVETHSQLLLVADIPCFTAN